MNPHTTNYENTFILIADDCPTAVGEVPPLKGNKQTVANLQFDMVIREPYTYTSDDVLFGTYAQRNDIGKAELQAAREQYFSKGQPCMRASPLTKRYGWGVHSNADGKIALFACDSEEYQQLAADPALKKVKAMKSSR